MASISENFGNLGISISHAQIVAVERLAVHFVLRGTHPLTFDGPYIGVHPVAFTTADYNALFDVFGLRKQDVEAKVRMTPSINRNFAVTSDPYNLLSMWLVHLAPIYIKDKKVCYDFQSNILRLWLYKIFCSVVNHSFRHGTNEGIMIATVSELSRKSDIIQYESWKRLIDSHVTKILDPKDRFYSTIVDGSPDEAFLRVVSESQTALRAKLVTFAQAYYEAYQSGNSVGSRSAVAENADGEKIVAQTASVIESATQSMVSDILNPHMFVHDISVQDVADMFSTISPRMLKTTLLKINETAVLQLSSRSFDKVSTGKEGVTYLGVRALVLEIARSTIRMCRTRRVNMGNRVLVFNTMKDAYRSSRNLDPDVINIKRSVGVLIDPFNITSNEASQSALRLAVIYYLIYRLIQKMK